MACVRISKIIWKDGVTPTEAGFVAEWIAMQQGIVPLATVPELPMGAGTVTVIDGKER